MARRGVGGLLVSLALFCIVFSLRLFAFFRQPVSWGDFTGMRYDYDGILGFFACLKVG